MPGIAGIAASRGIESLRGDVSRMAKALRHRPWYHEDTAAAEGVALTASSLSNEPHLAESEGCILAFNGCVYDVSRRPDETMAECLLRRYREGGPDGLAGLNGIYVAAVYDSQQQVLHLVNDRYGFKQLYYWIHNDAFHFASEYKAFLDQPGFSRQVNERAIADFMQLTYVLDCETLFSNVSLLPPASVATIRNGHFDCRTYWEPNMERIPVGARKHEDVLKEYADHVGKAVTCRMGERNLVLLTGGLDSRTLGGFIARAASGDRVLAVSMGFPKSYDARFGAQLAKTLGFEHHFVSVPPSYVADYAETGGWRLEGALSAHGYWSFEIDALLEKERILTVTHGLLGDSLAGERSLAIKPAIVGMNEEQSFDYLVKRFFSTTFTEDHLKDLLRPSLFEATKGTTRERLWNTYRRSPSDDFFDKVAYLDLRQRQRQFTRQQIEIYGALAETRAPFADNDFVDFMYTLPHEYREGKKLYKEMIMKYLPETTSVPYTSTGIPMNAGPWHSLALRARSRMKYKVLPKLTMGRYKPEHFGVWIKYDEWLRTGSRAYVTDVLNRSEYLEDFFNMDTVRRWLNDHMEGRSNNYGQVCALLTFAIWRKQFTS